MWVSKKKRPVMAYHLFAPVLRFRGEIVEGVVSLSDPTEQHSHHAWTQTHISHTQNTVNYSLLEGSKEFKRQH